MPRRHWMSSVHHTILLARLADSGILHDIWPLIKDLHLDICSKAKWLGDYSDRFDVNQGVRQRGILSTHLCKFYVHPPQDILKKTRGWVFVLELYTLEVLQLPTMPLIFSCPRCPLNFKLSKFSFCLLRLRFCDLVMLNL